MFDILIMKTRCNMIKELGLASARESYFNHNLGLQCFFLDNPYSSAPSYSCITNLHDLTSASTQPRERPSNKRTKIKGNPITAKEHQRIDLMARRVRLLGLSLLCEYKERLDGVSLANWLRLLLAR
uniref:Uncharacterized protein n=1 Tax=Arundo donax TaxID=35708 RepID=A0A0A9DDN1_ARUDO